MKQRSNPKSYYRKWLLLIPALVLISALILYWLKFTDININQYLSIKPLEPFELLLKNLSSESEHWGQFGDYLGGLLNPVIGGCTLIVAISVWRSQEKELKKTKKLLKEQISKQVFFDLLDIYQNVINGITPHPTQPHKIQRTYADKSYDYRKKIENHEQRQSQLIGKAALQDWCLKLDENHQFFSTLSSDGSNECIFISMQNYWENSETEIFLINYFKTIYKILMGSKNLLGKDHFRYVNLFKSQLSHFELILIAYYLIATKNEEFIRLSIDYHLLENMSKKHKETFIKYLHPKIFTHQNCLN